MQHDKKLIISIEELEKARKKYFLLQDIRQQIDYSYNTYHSPDLTKGVKATSPVSDPVTLALQKIEILVEKYEIIQRQFLDYQNHVTERINDPLIASLIMMYYFCGKSWLDVGIPDGRKRVRDYINNHKEELKTYECK